MKKSVLPVYLGARYNVERVGAPAVVVTMIGADELKRKLRPWKTGTRGFNATVQIGLPVPQHALNINMNWACHWR